MTPQFGLSILMMILGSAIEARRIQLVRGQPRVATYEFCFFVLVTYCHVQGEIKWSIVMAVVWIVSLHLKDADSKVLVGKGGVMKRFLQLAAILVAGTIGIITVLLRSSIFQVRFRDLACVVACAAIRLTTGNAMQLADLSSQLLLRAEWLRILMCAMPASTLVLLVCRVMEEGHPAQGMRITSYLLIAFSIRNLPGGPKMPLVHSIIVRTCGERGVRLVRRILTDVLLRV